MSTPGHRAMVHSSETVSILSVIIVSWNVAEFLPGCLDSIMSAAEGLPIQVVVVDNHSDDATVFALEQDYPWVELIKNAENVGFAAANNQGAEYASSRYILVLNPDTILKKGAIKGLLGCLSADDRIGIAGPRIVNADGSIQRSCARRGFSLAAALLCEVLQLERVPAIGGLLARTLMYPYDHDVGQDIDAISGAAFLIRSDLFSRLKGFNPDYFFGGEDLDLCVRARKAGYAIRYCPCAEVVHFGGGSSSKAEARTSIRAALSNHLYFLNTYGAGSALAYRLMAQFIRAPMLLVSGLFELIFLGRKDRFRYSYQVASGFIMWNSPRYK